MATELLFSKLLHFSLLPSLPFLRRDRSSSPALLISMLIFFPPRCFRAYSASCHACLLPPSCFLISTSPNAQSIHGLHLYRSVLQRLVSVQWFVPSCCFKSTKDKEPRMGGRGGHEREGAPSSFHKTNSLLLTTLLLKFYTSKTVWL